MKKVLLLTNIPAPYREDVYSIVGSDQFFDFTVLYCATIESNRQWEFVLGQYKRDFLTTKIANFFGRSIYLKSNVIAKLNRHEPDVVIIAGFSVPMLLAYCWALFKQKKVISFTDAISDSELHLTVFHRLIRYIAYRLSTANLGASQKSLALLQSYSGNMKNNFQSKLTIRPQYFSGTIRPYDERQYDILLCGQFIERKMFYFSLQVIAKIIQKSGPLKVKIMGGGPDREKIFQRASELGIQFDYVGFVQQPDLFEHYSDCRLFFFPSASEPWGIVGNEACAAATLVLTTPNVGCANELIVHGVNGLVLEPDVDLWAAAACSLLTDLPLAQMMQQECLRRVQEYTQQASADGIIAAIHYASGTPR